MTIRERIEGSKVFEQIWELAVEAFDALEPAGVERFYELLREKVNARFPPAVDVRDKPMSDHEFVVFGATGMPFGKHQDKHVASSDIPPGYLTWLADQKFTDDLRRYLKHPKVQERIRREHDEQEESDDDKGD